MCDVMPLNIQAVKNEYQYFFGILMNNFLDDGQRASLRSAHRLERDGKIRDRIKAVLMADRGKSISDIADILLVDEETVRRHLRDYLDRDSTGRSEERRVGKECR